MFSKRFASLKVYTSPEPIFQALSTKSCSEPCSSGADRGAETCCCHPSPRNQIARLAAPTQLWPMAPLGLRLITTINLEIAPLNSIRGHCGRLRHQRTSLSEWLSACLGPVIDMNASIGRFYTTAQNGITTLIWSYSIVCSILHDCTTCTSN
jgi:hypothetical protein